MALLTLQNSYPGTYRGSIIDHGVGLTKSKYPQWMGILHAEEYWDEEEKAWVSWADREDTDITAYLVLAGKEQREIFHCKSIEKALGWDGASWKALAELDLSETKIQFRVEEHTYDEKTSLQVAGIDHYDAEPGRTVQKLDASEVKDLDAQFATFFRKRKGERKPVKAVGKPIVPGKKAEPPGGSPPLETETEAAEESVDDIPPPTQAKPKATAKSKKDKGCTQGDAWNACKKAKDKSVNDKKLAQLWLETVEKLAPDGDENAMVPEQWAQVRDIVCEQVSGDEVAHL